MIKTIFFRDEVQKAPHPTLLQNEKGIKLNQNESPWDVPLELKVQITEKIIKMDFNRYPLEENLELKKQIARVNDVFPDQVALANGSNVLIQSLIHVIKNKARILILEPSHAIYRKQAELFGCQVVSVPLTQDFAIATDAVLNAMKKTKPHLILIANPNSPTGNLFSKESLYKIVRSANCLTVIDEAFFPYSGETLCDWVSEFPHLMILRTFSKAFSLAGVRLGYAIADTDVIYQLEKVLLPFCVSKISMAIVSEILDNDGFIRENTQVLMQERRKLFESLQKVSYVSPFPSDANFILFRVPNARYVFRELKKRQIHIRDVGDDNLLHNCLRVTVGQPEENKIFLEAMRDIMMS